MSRRSLLDRINEDAQDDYIEMQFLRDGMEELEEYLADLKEYLNYLMPNPNNMEELSWEYKFNQWKDKK